MIYVSSSIANFREKIDVKKIPHEGTLFIGLYHHRDWKRFILTQGKKIVWWCGSDILSVEKSTWKHLISRVEAEHWCENEVEQARLASLGITAKIHYPFYDDPKNFPVSYEWRAKSNVWMNVHERREEEYGLPEAIEACEEAGVNLTVFGSYGYTMKDSPNVYYRGNERNDIFNQSIRHYQGSLRLNSFDGCSEVMVKSLLLGQYPITRIKYPFVDCAGNKEELVHLLKELKKKKEPNPARDYWLNNII